ncbi:MAG: PQQ-like beta-propeller repeat protein [Verrucomicrobiales bacterium]|nr:PQQ-like beta-propeller repeat protein [Verrucomicrobiales bacterium]
MNQQPTRAVVAGILLAGTLQAADWSQYRGPHLDGSTPEAVRTNWAEKPLQTVWKKSLDPGWSSIAVSGGRLVTQVRKGTREYCVALDAATGTELWTRETEVASYDNLVGYDDRVDGPRSTPTISGEFAYVLTSQLKLHCLRLRDGGVVWTRDFVTEFGSEVISWQNAASPLLVDGLIFLNSNAPGRRLMAVRASDGTTVWEGSDDPTTHATPAYGEVGGVPTVVFLTGLGLVGVMPETGQVRWRLTFLPSFTSTAATPVLANDRVYASAAYGFGAISARITPGPSGPFVSQPWRQRGTAYQNHWSTPVAHEGFLYSVVESGTVDQIRVRSLACLDLVAGTNRWVSTSVGSRTIGFGSVIKVADLLLVLTESGELVLVRPDPVAYSEITRQKILTQYCWNVPVVSAGRLYARSSSELIALDVGAAPPALPELDLAVRPGPDSSAVVAVVSGRNGAPLDANAAGRIELRGTTELTQPLADWLAIPADWQVVGTRLESGISSSSNTRFLRAQEKSAGP